MRILTGLMLMAAALSAAGETLYNGIVLDDPWPPNRPPSRDPMPVPYLDAPPAVIPIDTGRQLFVDDFLIADTTLTRHYYAADYYPRNPVVTPDRPWEMEGDSQGYPAPTAMVFSDGVWWDPQEQLLKMWYLAGYCKATAYATSKDGVHWNKPVLDVVADTNIVHTTDRDSGTIWLDLNEKDPARRYKMFLYQYPMNAKTLTLYFSADGIHWSEPVTKSGPVGDRSTVQYNPFRNVWVYGIRDYLPESCGRIRRYWEHGDVVAGMQWTERQAPFWVGADKLDPPRDDLKTPCELYNLDAVAYESLMLGLFSIWRGQPKDRAKPNELCVGFSRDGFHWQRPMREAFIPVSETYGDWNWGNIQSAGGCCIVMGDQLWFYVSGRCGKKGSPASATSATGIAMLRRDGFASMDANTDGGQLTTRPVTFTGSRLFINADAAKGEVRAELLDADGSVLPGFDAAQCKPVNTDGTLLAVTWENGGDLAPLAGKTLRLRFHVRDARLFAFWIAPDENGASRGYVAAGGPGYTGPTDTVGKAALK